MWFPVFDFAVYNSLRDPTRFLRSVHSLLSGSRDALLSSLCGHVPSGCGSRALRLWVTCLQTATRDLTCAHITSPRLTRCSSHSPLASLARRRCPQAVLVAPRPRSSS
eukprot:418426-Rhodomonas_salina.2